MNSMQTKLDAELTQLSDFARKLDQKIIIKHGLLALEAAANEDKTLPRGIPMNTRVFIDNQPDQFTYVEWDYLSKELLINGFGDALAKKLVRELKLIKYAEPKTSKPIAEQEKGKEKIVPPNKSQPNQQTDSNKTYSGVASSGGPPTEQLSKMGITAKPNPYIPKGTPIDKGPVKEHCTPLHLANNGPEPKHPTYQYSQYVEEYGPRVYKTPTGESSHGKININILSNNKPSLWKQKDIPDPHFCYAYMLRGQCPLGRDCYLRHIFPTDFERRSLAWWNPNLVFDMMKCNRQRKLTDPCRYTRLFRDEADLSEIEGFATTNKEAEKEEAEEKAKKEAEEAAKTANKLKLWGGYTL